MCLIPWTLRCGSEQLWYFFTPITFFTRGNRKCQNYWDSFLETSIWDFRKNARKFSTLPLKDCPTRFNVVYKQFQSIGLSLWIFCQMFSGFIQPLCCMLRKTVYYYIIWTRWRFCFCWHYLKSFLTVCQQLKLYTSGWWHTARVLQRIIGMLLKCISCLHCEPNQVTMA
jgi:hypothetical protein